SPFIFLFVADDLAAILRQKVQVQEITPVRVCPRAPGISHLLFADDTLLFFLASSLEANNVKEMLNAYA
uniref:Reverse transcriptase domain-containing protein n=1 Tax=Triticum urartu TaxID=4572 RepID=A0A8R7UFF2_TRIUA